MSQIVQIVQTEKDRSEVTRNVIHLFQEGTRLMYSMSCFFLYGGFDGDVLRYERVLI